MQKRVAAADHQLKTSAHDAITLLYLFSICRSAADILTHHKRTIYRTLWSLQAFQKCYIGGISTVMQFS